MVSTSASRNKIASIFFKAVTETGSEEGEDAPFLSFLPSVIVLPLLATRTISPLNNIAKCSATDSTNPAFAFLSSGSASADTTATTKDFITRSSAASCVFVLLPKVAWARRFASRSFCRASSVASSTDFVHPFNTAASTAARMVFSISSSPSPSTFIASSSLSFFFAEAKSLATPEDTFMTEDKHTRRNANACFRCSINASTLLLFMDDDVIAGNTRGDSKIPRIRAMHLSKGTRKLVSGLNVKIMRKPCSGFSLASSSSGSLRNARFLPPSLPSNCIAFAPNGDPDCCGLSIDHNAIIKGVSTSAMHGSRKSGLSESTQNSNVRKPSKFNSLVFDSKAMHKGFASFGKCGRIDDNLPGKVKHNSTIVSWSSCGSGPFRYFNNASRHVGKMGSTSR